MTKFKNTLSFLQPLETDLNGKASGRDWDIGRESFKDEGRWAEGGTWKGGFLLIGR